MRKYFTSTLVLLFVSVFCVPIFGQTTLINNGSSWSYYDNQNQPSDQGGDDWNDLAYDDASWASGNAHLGYGDGDEVTTINSNTYTVYVRHEFNVTNPAAYSSLDLDLTYDDGAVVYLNGTEVWRVNMPTGTISYNTFTPTQSSDNALASTNIVNSLVTGTNVLAVEVHQRSSGSSDLSFDFELTAVDAAPPSGSDLIVANDTWRYLDDGSNQGTAWTGSGFDDSSWATGAAELGYGDTQTTTVSYGVDANNKYITTYFRKTINVADPNIFDYIDLEAIRDDGMIVYLNGVEVWRDHITGTVDYLTLADSPEIGGTAETTWITQSIGNSLVAGNNVIAVEIHQVLPTSSDISFNFKMIGASAPPVSNDIVDADEVWKYLDDGSNQGTAWTGAGFNDGSWASGNAELGYGDGEATTVSFGPSSTNKYPTTYFRKSFTVTDPSQYDFLEMEAIRDDGMAVYLNGALVWSNNMPGSWGYQTYASATVGGADETTWISQVVANTLVVGTNVLAVEIHQTNATSSDISFNFKLSGSTTTPGAVNVERGPYLQKGTSSSMVIKWRTEVPTESVVNYGTSLGNLSQSASDLVPKTEHELEITGLASNTVHYYEIANSSAVLIAEASDLYFKTHPTIGSSQPFTFWALGDPGTANSNQRSVRDAYYNYIGSNVTDGILFLGDNAYNSGTDNEYQNAVFENMYEDKLKNSVAWSCLGNHDGYSADSNSQTGPYYDIFTFPTAGESGGLASGTEAYYSFDYGNVHFIILDSYDTSRSVGGAMYNWAQSDIQNTTQEWIVAMWHHPPYTKGSHDSDSESQLIEMRQNFLPMLESNGVDLVLNGHSHSYERTFFLNGHYGNSGSFNSNTHTVGATGDGNGKIDGTGAYVKDATDPEGAVYITAGSSGKTSGGSLDHNAMNISLNQLGSCILEVDGNELNLKFIRDNGAIADYFTIQKGCSAGTSCDDGDACTENDVLDANCDCAGTPVADSDGDGVCDTEDQCPGQDDALIGTACDDGNACTANDVYDTDCGCTGIPLPDSDGDGICDEQDQCPGQNDALIGTACDDGDACTENDTYDSNCGCSGTPLPDSDGDGICDTLDQCPGQDDALIGTTCDDGDACTENDIYDANCGCSGTPVADSDGDGVCDTEDQCPGQDDALIGTACDDGDACTENDIYDANCGCSGTPVADSDGDGVCDTEDQCPGQDDALIGTSCDDGDACTENDVYDANCGCSGTPVADSDGDGVCDTEDKCPGQDDALIGTACDDGNDCTINDVYDANCGCSGTPDVDSDGDGVCDTEDQCPGQDDALIGTSCDDGDACTENDIYDANCGCSGTPVADSDGDGVCDTEDQCPGQDDALIGTSCDDGDACTENDVYDANCGCSGTPLPDSDGDGVCDTEDQCPGQDDALIGTACDDGDACTENDIYDANCGCNGTPVADSDGDGICDTEDQCPGQDDALIGTTCDDGDACTENDVYDANCGCSGTPVADSDGDGICDTEDQCPGQDDALIGTACDDGDACTENDIYDANCGCSGTPVADSDGDGVCDTEDQCPGQDDALIGTSCDDGDACTENDVYDANCGCAGTLTIDNDGDGYCAAQDADDNDPCVPDANSGACDPCGDIIFDGFESGFGNWNDGGSDCTRRSQYSNSGTYSIRIRDNSGSSSSMTTDNLDLSSYNEVSFQFSFYPQSMENNEDFFLEVSTNGGSSYTVIRNWARGTHFNNNTRYYENETISGPFSSSTKFRLRCDASGNNDKIFIDDVLITSCIGGGASKTAVSKPLEDEPIVASIEESVIGDIKIYPNPASDKLYLDVTALQGKETKVTLYNMVGQLVRKVDLNGNYAKKQEINLDRLSEGLYLLRIMDTKGKILKTKRIVIEKK